MLICSLAPKVRTYPDCLVIVIRLVFGFLSIEYRDNCLVKLRFSFAHLHEEIEKFLLRKCLQ